MTLSVFSQESNGDLTPSILTGIELSGLLVIMKFLVQRDQSEYQCLLRLLQFRAYRGSICNGSQIVQDIGISDNSFNF